MSDIYIGFKEAYGYSLVYKCFITDMIQTQTLCLNRDETYSNNTYRYQNMCNCIGELHFLLFSRLSCWIAISLSYSRFGGKKRGWLWRYFCFNITRASSTFTVITSRTTRTWWVRTMGWIWKPKPGILRQPLFCLECTGQVICIYIKNETMYRLSE